LTQVGPLHIFLVQENIPWLPKQEFHPIFKSRFMPSNHLRLFGYWLMHLCQLTISSHQFWLGATANPPKSDDWKWSTDKGPYIIKKEIHILKYSTTGTFL
jgi:hypothetical protein